MKNDKKTMTQTTPETPDKTPDKITPETAGKTPDKTATEGTAKSAAKGAAKGTAKSATKAYIMIIAAMLIWGTLGIFVKQIPLSSPEIVMCRCVLGGLFLGVVFILKGTKSPKDNMKKYAPRLILSGCCMGFNWVCLFYSYNFTTVSMATVAYYCAPIVVVIASPFVLGERITREKVFCVAAAMAGLILITGNLENGGSDPVKGFIFGLGAAVLYASVTLINKKVSGISGLEITIIQLISAGVVVLPYMIATHQGSWVLPAGTGLVCILIVGIIHSGLALYLYFAAVQNLPGHKVALCSYIDPVATLFFSAIFLNERMTFLQLAGAILIIGGAALGNITKSSQEES